MIAEFFLRFYHSITIIVIIVVAVDGNTMRLIYWARSFSDRTQPMWHIATVEFRSTHRYTPYHSRSNTADWVGKVSVFEYTWYGFDWIVCDEDWLLHVWDGICIAILEHESTKKEEINARWLKIMFGKISVDGNWCMRKCTDREVTAKSNKCIGYGKACV